MQSKSWSNSSRTYLAVEAYNLRSMNLFGTTTVYMYVYNEIKLARELDSLFLLSS